MIKCELCPAKCQKRFTVGRSLRWHLRAVHSDDPNVDRAVLARLLDLGDDVDVTAGSEPPALHALLAASRDNDCDVLAAASESELLAARCVHNSNVVDWAAGGATSLPALSLLLQRSEALRALALSGRTETRLGRMAIHWAARNGRLSNLRLLRAAGLATGRDVTADGTTPMHLALFGGHLDVAAFLFSCDEEALYDRNHFGCSAFHWSAMSESDASIRWVFERACPARISADDVQANGQKPIDKARLKGNEAAMRALSEWGCA